MSQPTVMREPQFFSKRRNSYLPMPKPALRSKERRILKAERPRSQVRWSNTLEFSLIDGRPLKQHDDENIPPPVNIFNVRSAVKEKKQP